MTGTGTERTRFAAVAGLALALYGVALWLLRPATPFELDELLFLLGLDRYDVAQHQPHPPGYPLYIAMGRAVRLVVRDPVVALQLLSVMAAMATVAGLWLLARRLGASRSEATLGAALLAATPTFLFHANVGFSDLPGTAVALFAAYLLLRALDDGRALVAGGAAAAAAVAIRPQLLLVLVPLGIAALAQSVRRRRWTALLLAFVAGAAVSALCWVPAVVITGPARFRQALLDATNWIAEKEVAGRFPGAPLGALARRWLVSPWDAAAIAVVFWLLVVAGGVLWWRSGRRRLVLVAGGSGLFYLLAGMATMHLAESVRYILPALPFLALLAAGVAASPAPAPRRLAFAAAAGWALAAVAWLWPTLALRRSQPAPGWEGVSWVADHADPRLDTVVYDTALKPHVFYLLRPRGFHLEERHAGISYASFLPGGAVVSLGRDPRPAGTVIMDRRWEARGLAALTRGLYNRCFVARAPTDTWVRYSGGLRYGAGGWRLDGGGTVSLPDGAPMQLLEVSAAERTLAVGHGGALPIDVAPGDSAFVPLVPGDAGRIALRVAGGGEGRLAGLDFLPVRREDLQWLGAGGAGRELFVPSVAHVRGRLQSLWVTDVLIENPDDRAPLQLTVHLEPEVNPPGRAGLRTRAIAPGQTILLADVVDSQFGVTGRGSLRLEGDRPFGALWRTYDRRLPHTMTDPVLLRALTASQSLASGALALEFRSGSSGLRSNAGFLNPSGLPVEVRYAVREPDGQVLTGPNLLRLPAHGYDQLDDDELLGKGWRKSSGTLTLEFSAPTPVLAFRSVIENESNRATFALATR